MHCATIKIEKYSFFCWLAWIRSVVSHMWERKQTEGILKKSVFMLRTRGADKSLARLGKKQANVSVKKVSISFGALPCRKNNLMTARFSMLLKSRASLTCFRACFLPGQAKDLSSTPVLMYNLQPLLWHWTTDFSYLLWLLLYFFLLHI